MEGSNPEPSKLLYPREMMDALFALRSMRPPLSEAAKRIWSDVVDTVFFASLYSEEGHPVRISVVWLPEESASLKEVRDFNTTRDTGGVGYLAWDVLPFTAERPFTPNELRKLSKGLEPQRHFVVLSCRESRLSISGLGILRPETDGGLMPLRVHSVGPGQLVFEDAFGESIGLDRGKLVTRETKLDEIPAVRCRLEDIFGAPRGTKVHDPYLAAVPLLVQQLRQTQAGALLVFNASPPSKTELQLDFYRVSDQDILTAKIFSAARARAVLVGTTRRSEGEEATGNARAVWRASLGELRRAVELIGRLSAIDGAVLAGPRMAIWGAGLIIGSGSECRMPIVERSPRQPDRHLERVGARHDAACRYVETHPEGIAFVVSADGPVSCALNTGKNIELWRGWMPRLEPRLLADVYDPS